MAHPTTLYSIDYEESFANVRRGCIVQLDNDSFILKFEKHLFVMKLDPFNEVFDLKFAFSTLEILNGRSKCFLSILSELRRVHNLPGITPNLCRDENDSSNWNFVNEIFFDVLFMQENATQDDNIKLLDVSTTSQALANFAVLLVEDGQILFYRNFSGNYEFFANLTSNLILSRLIRRPDILKQLKTLHEREKICATSRTIVDLIYQHKLAKLLACNFWLFFDGVARDKIAAISVQRDGSLFFWHISHANNKEPLIEISDVVFQFIDETITAAHLHKSDDLTYLLVGTSSGNIFSCQLIVENQCLKFENLTKMLELNDDRRVFQILVDSYDGVLRLVASKHNIFIVAQLTIGPNFALEIKTWLLVKSASKYPTLSFSDSTSGLIAFCRNGLFKCLMGRIHEKLDFKISPFLQSIGLDSKKLELQGFCISQKGALCLYCLCKKIPQKTCGLKQQKLKIVRLLEDSEVWENLLAKNNFNSSIPFLACLRYNLLTCDNLPTYVTRFMSDSALIEQFDSFKLMLLRFILRCILLRKDGNLKGQYVEWSDLLFKVEHKLLFQRAQKIVEFFATPTSSTKTMLSNVKFWLSKDQISSDSKFFNTEACPICRNTEFRQCPKDALLRLCKQGHKIPVCCSTLLCITDFSFRKCVRCYALANVAVIQAKDEAQEKILNFCGLCDGNLF